MASTETSREDKFSPNRRTIYLQFSHHVHWCLVNIYRIKVITIVTNNKYKVT